MTKLGSASVKKGGHWGFEEGHALRRHDTFPSSLCQATFRSIKSEQPLLQLTNLKDLTVLSGKMSDSQLLQLGAVSSLSAISLC